MKKTLLGIAIGFGVFAILSYKTTSNATIDSRDGRVVYNVPLKQKNVILVYDQAKASQLQKKGWIVQDVDLSFAQTGRIDETVFTMVLY